MASRYRSDSFIRNTALIDGTFLDINQLPSISASDQDQQYVISAMYDQRPDLLAHRLYENSRLFWVFALRNPDILVDPIRDFRSGITIWIPTLNNITQNTITGST